jgi:formate dehydrogenase iron-sulfur subunit
MASLKNIQEGQNNSKIERYTELSRKDFLFSLVGLFAAFGGLKRNGFTKFLSAKSLNANRKAILYDASKCTGCRMCEIECQKENKLTMLGKPGELSKTLWTTIQVSRNGNQKDLFLKLQCMHCSDASCTAVCPTGAAKNNGEYVVIDQNVCIGCGYCATACSFGVPHKSPPEGATQKCDFCFDRVQAGLKPACVEACPISAATFGARTELLATSKRRVDVLKKTGWPEAQLYGENDLGGLNVLYILLKPPVFYGLPEKPKQATMNVLAQWISGSLTAGVLILPFWYFYKLRSGKDKQSVNQKEDKE